MKISRGGEVPPIHGIIIIGLLICAALYFSGCSSKPSESTTEPATPNKAQLAFNPVPPTLKPEQPSVNLVHGTPRVCYRYDTVMQGAHSPTPVSALSDDAWLDVAGHPSCQAVLKCFSTDLTPDGNCSLAWPPFKRPTY